MRWERWQSWLGTLPQDCSDFRCTRVSASPPSSHLLAPDLARPMRPPGRGHIPRACQKARRTPSRLHTRWGLGAKAGAAEGSTWWGRRAELSRATVPARRETPRRALHRKSTTTHPALVFPREPRQRRIERARQRVAREADNCAERQISWQGSARCGSGRVILTPRPLFFACAASLQTHEAVHALLSVSRGLSFLFWVSSARSDLGDCDWCIHLLSSALLLGKTWPRPRMQWTHLCKVIHEYLGTAHAPDGQRVLGAWFLAAKRGPLTPRPQCGTS